MSFAEVVKPAEQSIKLNVGCGEDIMSGKPIEGSKGEIIYSGGLSNLDGHTGEANSFKTEKMMANTFIAARYYPEIGVTVFDTEGTLPHQRMINRGTKYCPDRIYVNEFGETDLRNITLTNHGQYDGEEFFDIYKKYGINRPRLKADYHETPFVDPRTGENLRILMPDLLLWDSISETKFKAVTDMQDATIAGDSKQNTTAMVAGKIKMQILQQICLYGPRNGLYYQVIAQIGEKINMSQYDPQRKTLALLGTNQVIRGVPDTFRYNTRNLTYTKKMTPLLDSSRKDPYYPSPTQAEIAESRSIKGGSTDLYVVNSYSLRNKGGPSGDPMYLVFSQTEGYLEEVTCFENIRDRKFGWTEKTGHYTLDLYPDGRFSRKSLRGLIKTDKKLCNAIRLSWDLCLVGRLWREDLDPALLPYLDPAVLASKLIELGYDLNHLLENTRAYWTFDQYTNPIGFMSVVDMMRMAAEKYTPYWADESWQKKYAPNWLEKK